MNDTSDMIMCYKRHYQQLHRATCSYRYRLQRESNDKNNI